MEEDKHKETAQINELLNKIKILKNGVLEERKKSQVYLNRIKEYEKTLQLKDAEVAQIIKEKYQLDLALQSEKSKKNKKSLVVRLIAARHRLTAEKSLIAPSNLSMILSVILN